MEDAMASKGLNPVGDHAVAKSSGQEHISLNQSAEMATGCFNCWLEKTSCDHHSVIAQASALMRAHQRISKVDGVLNRQAH
jgi:hypothetical protein